MKVCKFYAALFIAGLYSFPVMPQFHESIEVEGNYDPEVILHEKINLLPSNPPFNLAIPEMTFEENGVETDFTPQLYPMPATGWKTSYSFHHKPGYVEFGIGSWLNADLSAGYRFIDSSTDKVGIRLQHNSTSLWKPVIGEIKLDDRQYRYDERIGIYGSHKWEGRGIAHADLDYGLGLFNYYGTFNPYGKEIDGVDLPSQTLNRFNVKVGWKNLRQSPDGADWSLDASVGYMAYRRLYLPMPWLGDNGKGNRETDIRLEGDVKFPWGNDEGGLEADLNILCYSGPSAVSLPMPDGNKYNLKRPDNYGVLCLKPYYKWNKGIADIKLGVDIDLSLNAGLKGNRYSFFHIAPDVSASIRDGKFTAWISVTGGSTLNKLSYLRQYDYYGMPALTSTRPVYTPFDGRAGVNLGSFGGFRAEVEFAYRVSRNVRLGGWYQAWMDYGFNPMPSLLTNFSDEKSQILYSFDSEGINLHGGKISGRITYEYEGLLKIKAEGAWQPQKNKLGYFDGYDRPRITADFVASVSPLKPLDVSLRYGYRGVRKIYTREYVDPLSQGGIINGEIKEGLVSLRLPDLAMLDFSVSWQFSRDFGVWLHADNLLNRHDEYLPLQPAQGINFLIGLNWLF